MKETRDRKKAIFLFVRIGVVTAGILWGIYWLSGEQRWSKLAEVFGRMKLLLFLAALAAFTLGQTAVGLRWWILLRTQGVKLSAWMAVKLTFLGLFYNNFLPGSAGGDFVRAWYVTRHTERKFAAALSVFVDRAIGLASTLLIAVFFYFVYMRGRQIIQTEGKKNGEDFLNLFVKYQYWVYGAIFLMALLIALISAHPAGRKKIFKTLSFMRTRAQKVWSKFLDAFVLYCKRPISLLLAVVLTIALQIVTISGFYLLGADLGVDVSINYYYVFFALSWVIGVVPVSIAGAVVVEGSLSLMFVHFAAVELEPALALALCQRIVWMIGSLPGGLIHLSGMHLPKEFSVDDSQAMD